MRNSPRLQTLAIFTVATLLSSTLAQAAVTLSGTSYSESFNGDLGTTSLTTTTSPFTSNGANVVGNQAPVPGTSGWDAVKLTGSGLATSAMPYTVDNGAGTSGAIYSYGTTGATDRALGSLASGTNTPAFGVELVNNTGAIIGSVDISYLGEFWRSSTSVPNTLNFKYLVGASSDTTYLSTASSLAFSGLNLVGPAAVTTNGALDGTLAANQIATSGTLTGLNWTVGSSLYLIWQDTNDTGNDAGLAVDNVTLTAHTLAGIKPYWDPNGAAAGLGGAGNWNTTDLSWNDVSGTATPATFDGSQVAIFGDHGGTVTINQANVTANGGLQFDVDGYTITSNTLTIGTTNTVSVSNLADTATIGSKISGTHGLVKNGAGTLVLTSTSSDFDGTSLSGGTSAITVNSGTLSISADTNLGNTGNDIALNGGTFKSTFSGNLQLAAGRDFSGTGTISVASGNTLTIQGNTQMSVLTLSSKGTLALTGGTKTLGGLIFQDTGTLKAGTGTDTVQMNGNISTSVAGTTTIQAGLVDFGTSGRAITITDPAGMVVITGAVASSFPSGAAVGHLSVSGQGTLDIQGDSTNFFNSMLIGSTTNLGPTVLVHNSNSLGHLPGSPPQLFFNSGTIYNGTKPSGTLVPGSPINFGTDLNVEFGQTTAATAATYAGGNMTFGGVTQVFRSSIANPVTVNVNTNLTIDGGFAPRADALAPGTQPLIIKGTGTLTLNSNKTSGKMFLDVPLTVDTATVNFNGVNDGTVPIGIASTGVATGNSIVPADANIGTITVQNAGTLSLGVANAFPGGGATPTPPNLVLSGNGKLVTNGSAQTFGTLKVTDNGIIDLGNSGVNSDKVNFLPSSATGTWSLMRISNWSGSLTGGGSTDQVIIAGDATQTGLSTAQLNAVHFTGYLTGGKLVSINSGADSELVPLTAVTLARGDINQNGSVGVADISALMSALSDLNSYESGSLQFAGTSTFVRANHATAFDLPDLLDVADVNQDGVVDSKDLQAEIALVANGGGAAGFAAVPEPSTITLGLLGALAGIAILRKRS